MTSVNNLIKVVNRDVEKILLSKHTIDLEKYCAKRLPLFYPNKGLLYMLKKEVKIEIHHESFDLNSFLNDVNRNNVESVIDYYGSTHQRDYCLIVLGHRFHSLQSIQFRGILGYNRLYKLLLMLRIVGVPSKHIIVEDKNPDYRKIVAEDLNAISTPLDYVVIGGDVIIKPFLSSVLTPIRSGFGKIVSYTVYDFCNKQILFTSYPYGDLCWPTVEVLKCRGVKAINFVGSAGGLNNKFNVGDIFIPETIFDSFGTPLIRKFYNCWIEQKIFKFKISKKHITVKTPLIETKDFIATLVNNDYNTVDCEAGYFQQACETFLGKKTKVGILLFISDKPGLDKSLSEHDYSSREVLIIRRRLSRIIEHDIEKFYPHF